MKKLIFFGCILFWLGVGISKAQYNDLLDFNGVNGGKPMGSLTLSGTTLYGVAEYGGAYDKGCLFSYNTNGNVYTDLLDFNGIAISNTVFGQLILSGTTLYGMTWGGGTHYSGNIFSFNTVGNVATDLFDFNGTNGGDPYGSLIISGTTLYGMTGSGGAYSYGNIFSFNTIGNVYTVLLDFNRTNGGGPGGSLILSGNKLYGMTSMGGGSHDSGCVFSINTNGSGYKDLFDFDGIHGNNPYGSLTISGNKLYGMTCVGGAHDSGCVFSVDTDGSGYTDLLDFNGANGNNPEATGSLIISGTTLLGMTTKGGAYGLGCVFSFNTNGNVYTKLLDFNGINGASPVYGSLTLSGNVLYGMTSFGGANDSGVIFSFKDTIGHLGVNNLSANVGSINVYPNPSNGAFTLRVESEKLKAENGVVEVYNMLGEKVYSSILPQTPKGALNNIDLSNRPDGVYLYRVISESGSLLGEGKLIIQK